MLPSADLPGCLISLCSHFLDSIIYPKSGISNFLYFSSFCFGQLITNELIDNRDGCNNHPALLNTLNTLFVVVQ